MQIALALGAGASRGVSYARSRQIMSPLDRDFFDLLQRLEPQGKDEQFVDRTIRWAQELPYEYWRSMERTFYTLHLQTYLRDKFTASASRSSPENDADFVSTFVNAVGALLRAAHGKQTCDFHKQLLANLGLEDAVISFNYDLVVERALKAVRGFSRVPFGRWLYGFESLPQGWTGPTFYKLHGSFNWEMPQDNSAGFDVHTQGWPDLEQAPGFRRFKERSTKYPIFLPFWDKRIESKPWIGIWQQAFKRLADSDAVIVWGYSLPETDVKARLVFQLALADRQFNLCVIDPALKSRDRWRELFPDAKFWEFENIEQFLEANLPWWREHLD